MTSNPDVRLAVAPKRTAVSMAVSAAIIATTFGAAAYAQDIEEIVVTATKREESVQDVPIAITALSGDFTRAVNLDDVKDLISFTPGISGNSQDSFIDAVSIRGVRTQDFGIGGDPSAAIFKNDLYEGRNGAAVTSLYDIERAEVLRGPQGFLFGRNSIGGAISVHTRRAEIGGGNSGYVDVDVGERGRFVVEGAVNVPVSETFAMRFAGYHSQEDGFVPNFASGTDLIEHDKQAIRWSTTYENGALSLDTQVEFETREQSGSVYRAVTQGDTWDNLLDVFGSQLIPAGGERDADSDQSLGDSDDSDILTIGARLDYDFENFTLTSITGYKDHDFFYTEDYDGTPLNINNYRQDQEGDYLQQELRVVSNTEGALSWYAGMSFYKEEIETVFTNAGDENAFCAYYGAYYYPGYDVVDCQTYYDAYNEANGFPLEAWEASPDGLLREPGTIRGDYSGWAAYVDLSLELGDNADVSIGVRHTDDEKEFIVNVPTPESGLGPYWAYGYSTDGDIVSRADWSDTTVRVVGRWRPTDSAMLYASYTEGYKSGGFGSFSLVDANGDRIGGGVADVDQASGAQARQFRPEQTRSYEVGYKDSLGNTDLSLSAFVYDYEDLQISFFDSDSGANTVENVGQVDGVGIEATVTTEFNENWNGYLALSWLDTEATGLQAVCDGETPDSCEGSTLFWAPEWTGAAVLSGRYPYGGGAFTGSLELFWESERGGGWAGLPETMIDSYVDVALRVEYESDGPWIVGIYVENLTDEFTYDGLNNNGEIIPAHFFGHKRPRTVGARVVYSWE